MPIGKKVDLSYDDVLNDSPNTGVGWVRSLILLLLPLSAAIGGSVISATIGPIEIYPFKVLVPVLFVLTMLTSGRHLTTDGATGVITALTLWTGIGLVWSLDRGATIQLLSVFVFIVLLFLALRAMGTGVANSLVLGWRIALVVTGMVAATELLTSWHLPTEFVLSRAYVPRTMTLSVFNNPNDYGAFLALAIPVSLFPIRGYISRFAWLLAGASTVFLITSSSRFALIGFLAIIITALLRNGRGTWGLPTAWSMVLFGVTAVAVLTLTGASIITKFTSLATPGTFTAPSGAAASSAGDRVGLILNGLWSLGQTGGLGTGGGTFEVFRETWDLPFFVRGETVNPHNMWIEVTTELGAVGLVLILTLIWVIYKPLTKRHHPSEPGATVLWAALAGYVFAVGTPSAYLKSPVSWMFLGTVYVLARSITGGSATRHTVINAMGDTDTVDDGGVVIAHGSLRRPRIEPLRRGPGAGGIHGRVPMQNPIRPMMSISIGLDTGRPDPTDPRADVTDTRSDQSPVVLENHGR